MDFTPHLQNISEDSGCLTGTILEASSNTYDEASTTTQYIETPTTASTGSRKRKILHHNDSFSYGNFESCRCETPNESPAAFERNALQPSHFMSSTLNESLSKSLEKCNIGNYTLNYYSERSPSEFCSEHSAKRHKIDDSPKYQPKTRSAPSTPTKHFEMEELNVAAKAQSEHLTNFYYSPESSGNYKKLGTAEGLELLYPNLKPTPSPRKLKTPEKLREFLKKVNSPAKKRLFESSLAETKSFKRVDRDPVSVFFIKNDFRHIVYKIFEYLSASDLCSVSKVSKTWRKALHSDYKAFPRYYAFSVDFCCNKENIWFNSPNIAAKSPPQSPERDSFYRCTKIASQLSPSQSILKCLRCMEPAVIQRSISQCQNPKCEYIYCINCLSFSTSGPESFVDKCHTSELVVDSKQKSSGRFSLYDISNGSSVTPSFLLSEPLNMPLSKYDSSGYLSESDASPAVRQNLSVSMEFKPLQVLQSGNSRADHSVRRKSRRSSLVAVVSPSTTPRIVEIAEPSSPPRVKTVACSKQSKKNLKRLHF